MSKHNRKKPNVLKNSIVIGIFSSTIWIALGLIKGSLTFDETVSGIFIGIIVGLGIYIVGLKKKLV